LVGQTVIQEEIGQWFVGGVGTGPQSPTSARPPYPLPTRVSFPGSLAPSVLSWVTSGCGLRGRLAKVRQIQRCLPCGSEAGFSSSYEEQGPREES